MISPKDLKLCIGERELLDREGRKQMLRHEYIRRFVAVFESKKAQRHRNTITALTVCQRRMALAGPPPGAQFRCKIAALSLSRYILRPLAASMLLVFFCVVWT